MLGILTPDENGFILGPLAGVEIEC